RDAGGRLVYLWSDLHQAGARGRGRGRCDPLSAGACQPYAGDLRKAAYGTSKRFTYPRVTPMNGLSGTTAARPRVSVIIPFYNCRYVRQAVDSALGQTHENI